MFNNKIKGRNNAIGQSVAKLRKNIRISQRELSDRLQLIGLDVDKNAIQRLESGQRFVTDIEIHYICKIFNTTYEELVKGVFDEEK